MADPNTIRILELDGGGERGYFSLTWFDQFVQEWGIDPTTIAQQFDVICGTSVGGIMALSLANGMTPAEMFPFFTTQGPYIFSLSSVFPSWRPNSATKVALILADIPFYQSSGPTANSYGSGLLSNTLQNTFGSSTLQDLKTNVVIPSFEADTNTYVLFSNMNVGGLIGQNELISDVGLATGSAPVYLPPWNFRGHSYLDGGIYQNNPAMWGIVLGKILKPNANRICLLSVGTGLGELGFNSGGSDGIPLANNPLATTNGSSSVIVTIPTTSILINGQNVTISGATDTGGIIANQLNITASISIISSTTFSYTSSGTASSSTNGGGSAVIMDYIPPVMMRNNFVKKSPFHPTGINHLKFIETPIYKELLEKRPDLAMQVNSLTSSNIMAFDTIETIFSLFETASVGGQESIAQALLMNSLYTLDQFYYYRFNSTFDPTKNTELDSTDSDILDYYQTLAINLFNGDISNISTFIGHLTA